MVRQNKLEANKQPGYGYSFAHESVSTYTISYRCALCGLVIKEKEVYRVELEEELFQGDRAYLDDLVVHKECLENLQNKYGYDTTSIAITIYNAQLRFPHFMYSPSQIAKAIAFSRAIEKVALEGYGGNSMRNTGEIDWWPSNIGKNELNNEILVYDRKKCSIYVRTFAEDLEFKPKQAIIKIFAKVRLEMDSIYGDILSSLERRAYESDEMLDGRSENIDFDRMIGIHIDKERS